MSLNNRRPARDHAPSSNTKLFGKLISLPNDLKPRPTEHHQKYNRRLPLHTEPPPSELPKPRAQQTQDSIPTESPKFLPKTQQKKINKRPETTNGRTQPTHSKGLSHRTETPFMNPRKLEPNKPKTGFPRNNRNSH